MPKALDKAAAVVDMVVVSLEVLELLPAAAAAAATAAAAFAEDEVLRNEAGSMLM